LNFLKQTPVFISYLYIILVKMIVFGFIFAFILTVVCQTQAQSYGAVYFSTNDLAGSYVVVNSILGDGSLQFHSAIPTNGSGVSGESALLNSADSLIVGDNNLFVVNAGSHTVSMFAINPANPSEITLVNTASSYGETPTSLAYSSALRMLCVLNGGTANGIACFSVDATYGLTPLPQTFKSFGLQLPSLPKSPLGTVSDLQFTRDSTRLLVAVKGNPKGEPQPTQSFIASFPVTSAQSLGEPFVNSPVGTLPYSMTLIPGTGTGRAGDDQAFVFTDPGVDSEYGLGLVRVASNGQITTGVTVPIPGQRLSCWSDFSTRTGNLFTVDYEASGVKQHHGVVSEFAVRTNPLGATMLRQYALPGLLVDARIATLPTGQDFLYVLTGGKGPVGLFVMSVDQSADAKLVQSYTPTNTGHVVLSQSVAGLATYVIRQPQQQQPQQFPIQQRNFNQPQNYLYSNSQNYIN
jgi:hypothetical protein